MFEEKYSSSRYENCIYLPDAFDNLDSEGLDIEEEDPAENSVKFHRAIESASLFLSPGDNLRASMKIQLSIPSHGHPIATGSTWKLEIWHEETGRKVKYNGPYDACCGLLENSQCDLSAPADFRTSDCPLSGAAIDFLVSRSVPYGAGHYEATFSLFETGAPYETICVIFPFSVSQKTLEDSFLFSSSLFVDSATVDPIDSDSPLLLGHN